MDMPQQTTDIHLEVQRAVTFMHLSGDITAFAESSLGEADRKASEQGADVPLRIPGASTGIPVWVYVVAAAALLAVAVALAL